MATQFRDIDVAPLPAKRSRPKKPRAPKYPMDGIPVGGARIFQTGENARSTRNAIYSAARKYAQANEDFHFKVSLNTSKREVIVYRLDGKRD